MKAVRVLAFVLVGIGSITCAVVFAQPAPQDLPKQPLVPATQELLPINNGQPDNYPLWGPSVLQPGLREQSGDLARQYAKAEKEEDKKEIRKKLADVLGKQFDAQMDHQQKELVELEKQIASLRSLLKKRQDAKTAIIDRRMEQLIQDAEGLGWRAPPGLQPGANFSPSPYYRSSLGRFPGDAKNVPLKK
jgi:hypothetical protein